MADNILTADELRRIMSYDPETGLFTWLTRIGARGNPGSTVGSPTDQGYRMTRICGKQYLLHRLAFLWMTGEWPSDSIDHINRNRADNRWSNLRVVTHAQNHQNRSKGKNNKSGVLGVCWSRRDGRWIASITINYKRKSLGHYTNKDDAIAARKAAEQAMFTHST